MSRHTLILCAAALVAAAAPVSAQNRPPVPEAQQVRKLPRQQLSGPRFGFTTFTGDVAEQRQAAGLEPIMSQFGWQFENQVVSLNSGNRALIEGLVLMGGLEQGELNLSFAGLAGYRTEAGIEFGAGPNFNFNKDSGDVTTSMLVAAGATLPFGDIYVPVNVAMGLAKGGPRVTALMGWIIG
jgi:hypothetical protein